MYQDLPGLPLFLAAIALVPAFLSWRRGRILTRGIDDPALPELLEAARRRNGSIIAVAFGILVVMSPSSLDWTLALLAVGHVVAWYPIRKTLYSETWSLAAYLTFVARLGVGVWGFWLVLAMLPFQAPRTGRFDWVVAIVVAGALALWNARADVVLRRMLRSRPITDSVLLERLEAVAKRSTVAMPNFEWVPMHGGAVANALALPALPRSSVLFSETLLSHLDADEVTAICAHEIAHLEHHTPRVLRQINLVTIATIATGALCAVLPRLAGWETTVLPSVLWLVVSIMVIAWRARDRQKNETASDVRAIALTGDPEALVRALTKLYTFARMPRRIDADTERRATHPSLARRIRDIRQAAGTAPAALGDTSLFLAPGGATRITFDTDRLHWAEGDVASHSLSYSQFSELRLQATGPGATSLLARERGGRRWQTPIASADVPRLQAVLDIVDGRLAAETRAPATFGNMARVAAGFAAAFAFATSQIGMAIAALIALLQPSTPLLAAAGVAALGSAPLAARTFADISTHLCLGLSAMLALLGVGLLGIAYNRRGDRVPPRMTIAVVVLAICATFWTGLLLLNGLNPVALHLSARSSPAAGVFLLALGTTLVCLRPRPLRYVAAPLLLGGLTVLGMGSPLFLDQFGRDPFLQPAPALSWTSVNGRMQSETHLPFHAWAVELSPGGRAFIARSYDSADENTIVHVGRPGGRLTRVRAPHLVFVDDDRLLGVYGATSVGGMEIRETPVDAPDTVTWRQPTANFTPHSLTYHARTRAWTARGVADDGSLVQLQGEIDSAATRHVRWPPLGTGRVAEQTAGTGESLLVHETRYAPSFFQRHGWWQLALLMPTRDPHSLFSHPTETAWRDALVTRFKAQCVSAPMSRDGLLCSTFDGTRTRFASIDPESAQVTPLAWLPGRFHGSVLSSSGWLSGWADWKAVAIRPSTHEGIRFDAAPERITQLTATEDLFAAVSIREGASTLRIYTRSDARRAAR